jgi:BirA family biotin operon repressor/biotin-[acetyl-CoA-carboxylase] ligase
LYKILARTLFLGKNVVYVPQCHSTNTLAAEACQKEEVAEGTIVITDDQVKGRGQRGNIWESEPGKNLTFSIVLRPVFLSVKDQFQISRAVSLAVADYLVAKGLHDVRVKWPNDVVSGQKKICGILIENHLSGSAINYAIAGIGININQEVFKNPAAGSLRQITGREYRLPDELETLIGYLEARYLELKQRTGDHLREHYRQRLYRRGASHRFRAGQDEFDGVIVDVDEIGRLRIRVEDRERVFGVKEVEFL